MSSAPWTTDDAVVKFSLIHRCAKGIRQSFECRNVLQTNTKKLMKISDRNLALRVTKQTNTMKFMKVSDWNLALRVIVRIHYFRHYVVGILVLYMTRPYTPPEFKTLP